MKLTFLQFDRHRIMKLKEIHRWNFPSWKCWLHSNLHWQHFQRMVESQHT